MKQFQVVQQIPDLTNGIITANFGLPVKIEPYSQIALDKFQAVIDQTLTKINISDQIVSLSINGTNYYNVFIPSANYQSVNDFLQVFIQRINNSFNAQESDESFNSGIGLKITGTIIANSLSMVFVSVALFLQPATAASGCDVDGDGFYVYDGDASLSWIHTALDVSILKGGGWQASANYRPDIIGGQYTTSFRLVDPTDSNPASFIVGFFQGLAPNPSSVGVISVSSTRTLQTIIIPSSIFYGDIDPGTTNEITFFQKDGYFAINIYGTVSGIVGLLYSYGGSNETGLGIWNTTDNLICKFSGTSTSTTPYTPQITNPGFSASFKITPDSITGSGDNYSVLMDLTQADQIRLGFGISPNLIVFSPLNSNAGSYLSINNINFSSLRSALSLSLEILELPLDSFISGSSTYYGRNAKPPPNALSAQRQPGQRVNVISFFVPQIIDIASNLFRYQSSEYQWLNMVNKQTLEFSSLNFRVYITETGQPLQANNLSFNFLTRDMEEAGFSQSNSNEVVSKFQYK